MKMYDTNSITITIFNVTFIGISIKRVIVIAIVVNIARYCLFRFPIVVTGFAAHGFT